MPVAIIPEKINIHHLVILDKSGSMGSMRTEAINGYNEQIQTAKLLQEKFPNQTHTISLITFNTFIEENYICKNVNESIELNKNTYITTGSTALYDSIMTGIEKLQDQIKSDTDKVNVTILTDGQENASKVYKNPQAIAEMIKKLTETTNWEFHFIGCAANTLEVAKSFNISTANTVHFNGSSEELKASYRRMSKSRMSTSYSASPGVYSMSLDAFQSEIETELDKAIIEKSDSQNGTGKKGI